MALISSGGYSGQLDNHLVFINMIYGTFLNFLYFIFPTVEWYTVLFIVFNILSTSIIGTIILKSENHLFLKVLMWLFLYSFFIEITAHFQFTKTAGITAIAGILMVQHFKEKASYFGVFLVVLASLIRFEAAFLVLIISLPTFLIPSLTLKKLHLDIKSKLFIVMICVAFISKLADRVYYYQDADWSYFVAFNALRGKINDNPNIDWLEQKLPTNLSASNFRGLGSFFINPVVLDTAILTELHSNLKKIPLVVKVKQIHQLKQYRVYLALAFTLLLLFLYQEKNTTRLVALLLFGLFIGLLCYIALDSVVKHRVFIISLAAFVLILLTLLNEKSLSLKTKMIPFVILALSLYLNKNSYSKLKNNQLDYNNSYLTQSKMLSSYFKNNNKKIVPFMADYRLDCINPFYLSSNFQTNKIYLSGWLTHIPFNKDKFDSFEFFLQGGGLFVSKKNYDKAVSIIQNSLLAKNKIAVSPKIIDTTGAYLIVEFIP